MTADIPINHLKRALNDGRPQVGIWSSLAHSVTTEILAGAGFDWILIDTEHSPNDVKDVLGQLHAMQGGSTSALVRPAWNDAVLFKRLLDIGVQSFVVPWVQDAAEARRAVEATRYPPEGVRGVAATIRANSYGRLKDYTAKVHAELCVIVQLETRMALDNLEAIAEVDGVDGLFIGPSDLAASMGYLGRNTHPDVRSMIESAGARIQRTGKFAGILAPSEADARHWLEQGFLFVGLGSDAGLFARESEALAARFKQKTQG